MRASLLWKLLAINIPVIGLVVLVVWLMVDYLAADYFSALMSMYDISPSETHQMFLDAIHRYLIQATVVAVVLAGALSYLVTRRMLRPLSDMAEATRRVAAGDYGARVAVRTSDEVGQLGEGFNRMAESLERMESLRRRMVSDIAHELRTPLTNVRGYLEGLSDGVVPPSKETLDVLQREIMRLVRLIEDLERLNRAEAARAHLRREPLAIGDLVDQAVKMNRREFDARGIAVETRLPDDGLRIVADRDKLLQVLGNLVQNAWQHSPSGGTVRVAARRIDGEVEIMLSNSGGTLSERDLPYVFERFWRAEKSRSRDSGGAGIGLSIVKELVEAHGGRVGAAREDGEARFWFTLPA